MALYLISERAAQKLLAYGAKLQNITGRGVVNRDDGISINPPTAAGGRSAPEAARATIVPVTLISDGGSAGTVSSTVSFTYTPTFINGTAVTAADGTPVTGLAPASHRMPNVVYEPATFGYLHRDASGNWALGLTNEGPADPEECVTT